MSHDFPLVVVHEAGHRLRSAIADVRRGAERMAETIAAAQISGMSTEEIARAAGWDPKEMRAVIRKVRAL